MATLVLLTVAIRECFRQVWTYGQALTFVPVFSLVQDELLSGVRGCAMNLVPLSISMITTTSTCFSRCEDQMSRCVIEQLE